jgi:hypothetical protein
MNDICLVLFLSVIAALAVSLFWAGIKEAVRRMHKPGDCSSCPKISRGYLDFAPLWTCPGCEVADRNLTSFAKTTNGTDNEIGSE